MPAWSRRSVLGRSWLVLAGLLLPGCRPTPTTIRLGLVPWPPNDLYALAEHLGLYAGVPLRIVDYSSADQGLQAVRNHAADVYPCTLDEALLLASELPELRIVQVLDSSFGADVILAQPEVASLQDLRGRRIGYEATALGAYVLSRGLATAGLQPADVTPVFVQVNEHERVFLDHRVDAVVTYEPVRGRLLAAGAHVVFDSTQIPGEIVDVLVASAALVEARSDTLAAIVRGWLAAAERLRTRPEDTTALLARRMGVSPDQVPSAFARIRLADLAENRALLEPGSGGGKAPRLAEVARRIADTMVANRLLPRTPDLDTLFDARVVARVAPATGG